MASIFTSNKVPVTVIASATTGSHRKVRADNFGNIEVADSELAAPDNVIYLHEADAKVLEAHGVADIHRQPTLDNAIADEAADQDVAYSFTFDADVFGGKQLTYTATQADDNPLPAWVTFTAATRTFAGTPLVGDVGTLSVKVTATNLAGSVSDTFDIVVAGV